MTDRPTATEAWSDDYDLTAGHPVPVATLWTQRSQSPRRLKSLRCLLDLNGNDARSTKE